MEKTDFLREDALRMLSDLDLMLCNAEHSVKTIDSVWLVCICPFLDCLVSIASRLLTFISEKK